MSRKDKERKTARSHRGTWFSCVLAAVFSLYAALGVWFVHHARRWLDRYERDFGPVAAALEWVGNPIGDITDGLGITGHDAVYEYDLPAPEGEISFAGLPVRRSAPAPQDIVTLSRGEFQIGWSPSLQHPVWVQYHVPRAVSYEAGKRPSFSRDRQLATCPAPSDYADSGYDRGHMAPNYALATRFGPEAQKRTFLMSNIAPQSAALNRGPWRKLEHRIADLWTACYGEIWVTVGCFTPADETPERLGTTRIDAPSYFYMLVVAQEGLDVRALAVLLPQTVGYDAYPARYLVTIDQLEELTGLDFLPDLPSFLQSPLQAELPTRLWPVKASQILKLLWLDFSKPY